MNKNIFSKTQNKLIFSLLLLGTLFGPLAFRVSAADLFAGGDFMTAVNNTQRTADWADSVSANPGEIIEYRITAQNIQSGTIAHDVTFHVNYPTTPSNSPQVQGVVSANGISVSDTATVKVNGTAGYLMVYESGHTRVFSSRCPGGCNADDSFRNGGNINVGDLAYGESAQVLFKVGITNPRPTPTATPTPTPTATPAPTAAPTGAPGPQGPAGPAGAAGASGNANATANATANAGGTTAAPVQVLAATTTLPKTGLPLASLALTGLIPVGLKLRKIGKVTEAFSATSTWAHRTFKKD